jgi:ABC-type sulfate transport system substrate-binding protein
VVVPPVTVTVESAVVVVDIVVTAVDTVAVARMFIVDLGKINTWTRHPQ